MGGMGRRLDVRRSWAAVALLPVGGLSVSCSGSDAPAVPVRSFPIGRTGDRCQYLDRNPVWHSLTVGVHRDGFVDFDLAQHG